MVWNSNSPGIGEVAGYRSSISLCRVLCKKAVCEAVVLLTGAMAVPVLLLHNHVHCAVIMLHIGTWLPSLDHNLCALYILVQTVRFSVLVCKMKYMIQMNHEILRISHLN